MKKFIAVFDGYNMSKSTLDYAIAFTKASGSRLLGIFLDDPLYRSYDIVKVIKTYNDYDTKIKELDLNDKKIRDASVVQFQQLCEAAGIDFSIRRNDGFALEDLKQESMFADLLIINETETFSKYKQPFPTRFLKDLLGDVQCPVVVVPSKYIPLEKVVLLYDGSPSSLYAVKTYSYILSESLRLPVEVFTVKDTSMDALLTPNSKLMSEFIEQHFVHPSYIEKEGNVEEEIVQHLKQSNCNDLIVLGAYRRSEFSRWLKPSMADLLIRELDMPLFIAHNK